MKLRHAIKTTIYTAAGIGTLVLMASNRIANAVIVMAILVGCAWYMAYMFVVYHDDDE